MKRLELTGLGNEVDISSGKTIFTAVFNGTLRIPISKEAAEILYSHVYEPETEEAPRAVVSTSNSPQTEESGDNGLSGFTLGEVPQSAYGEADDGVESV